MRPKKYPYKTIRPLPPTKRVKKVIEQLRLIKQDFPNPSKDMKPRVKALAELTSEDVRDYDLQFAPLELVSQLRDLQSSFLR